MKKLIFPLLYLFFAFTLLTLNSCSSGPEIQQQKYAHLRTSLDFEYSFPAVWKAIETTLHEYRIASRDPSDVDPMELKKISERSLETEWVYTQSKDKYVEYKVNDFPRKKYLQMRVKFIVSAERKMPDVTKVSVQSEEQLERLKDDGSPNGYVDAEEPDTARINQILQRIRLTLLASNPN